MNANNLNQFNIITPKILLGVITLMTFSHSAYALDNTKPSSAAQELLKTIKTPQYQNNIINNLQYQNDTELAMFIMKSIEEKNIKEANKKIDFVNTFKVSDEIKDQVKSMIKQNINYSDHEKVSYGIYLLKKCNDQTVSVRNEPCYFDYAPNPAPNCVPQRSNVCCK